MRAILGALLLLVATAPAAAVDVGSTVTPEFADEVRDLVLPGVVEAVRRGMRIEVIEPRRVRWRRAFEEATEKYAAQVSLGPDGELRSYVAGLPFPHVDAADPQAALKMMWNHAFGPWISDDAQSWSFEWQTGVLRPGEPMRIEASQRDDIERAKFLRLVGRTEVPPLPALPGAAAVFSMEIYGPTLPVFRTLSGGGPLLIHRHLDLREPDVWFYTGADRKVRRLSPKILYEAVGDIVADVNSAWGFSAPLGSYTFRLVGERRLLGAMHARRYPSEWCPQGGDFAPCEAWEARSAHVIEATARKPYDIYSKRVIVLDTHAWVVLASDLYDRQGRLWKTYVNFWSFRPDARGDGEAERPYLLASSCVDLLEDRAYRWRLPGTRPLESAVAINTGLAADVFSPGALESARGE